MLEQHLRWDYACPSEFSSWSSSLLFVLRHAVRKKYCDLAKNVCIYVLDSRKSVNNSIYPATSLLQVYEVKSEKKLRHEYYATEYLLHGALENANSFSVVALEILERQGLYQQFPELNEERRSEDLYLRVLYLRRLFFGRTWTVTDEEVKALRKMAECFSDDELVVPVTAALLSLRRRGNLKDNVLEKILIGSGRTRFPQWTPFDVAGFEKLQSEAGNIHEVSEFAGLLQRLYDIKIRQDRQQTDHVLGSFQMLSCKYPVVSYRRKGAHQDPFQSSQAMRSLPQVI